MDAKTPGAIVAGWIVDKKKSGGIVVVLMIVSGGQVLPVLWKVTSARCIQMEPTSTVNCRPTAGWKLGPVIHTRTRESQEVTVGLTVVRTVPANDISVASRSEIVRTDIPYCGQLNITTSTLLTPLKPGVDVNSKATMPSCLGCSVRS